MIVSVALLKKRAHFKSAGRVFSVGRNHLLFSRETPSEDQILFAFPDPVMENACNLVAG